MEPEWWRCVIVASFCPRAQGLEALSPQRVDGRLQSSHPRPSRAQHGPQLYGRKNWNIAPPTHEFPTQLDLNNTPSIYPESVCTDMDTGLYLPWGSWHHAEPLENSIHMSIGIHEHPFFPLKILLS